MQRKMERQQLLDALTDHMAVYHCRKKQLERRHCGDKGDRQKVVQWLTGLSVSQRQVAFTIVDEAWVAVLLQMQKHLQSEGPGSFFVLPDFPSAGSQKQNAGSTTELLLPSLCFRRARGLLRRLSCEGESLVGSLRLYSSLDGEVLDDSSRKLACRSLDSVTVSYEFLEDIDKVVEAMDKLSYGEFLASQCFSGGSSWEETPWLKAMGYYSLPAFVANRLEISLWSAWISALGTKQPPKTLPRSVARAAFDNATLASRMCTKRRGFEDWWNRLNMNEKNKASTSALASILKFEASKIDVPINELNLEVIPSNNPELTRLCLGIQVMIKLRSTLNKRVVYSSLAEAHGFAEQVVRAVRNILMKVMKDSMEYELLDHGGKAPKGIAKKLQVRARKNKNKKQKGNASHKCYSAVEESSTESHNLDQVVETTRAPQQQVLECPDTGWIAGKKKKRNKHEKKVKPDDPSRIPGEVAERESSARMEENNLDPTPQQPSSTTSEQVHTTDPKCQPNVRQVSTLLPYVKNNQAIHWMPSSHEWPGASRSRFSGLDSSGRPAATEWLHLDVNRDWQHHAKQSLYAYSARPTGQVDSMIQRGFLSKANMSWDWPPMVQSGVAVGSPVGFVGQAKEEPGFVPVPLTMNGNIVRTREIGEVDEGRDTDDDVQGDCDDYTYRNSEGEGEKKLDDPRQVYEVDYNQIFGGGVMYWTSADYTGMGYSRPGSLSSEESSWARREADLTVVVDDIVGLPSVATAYPGLSSGASCTSPSSASSLSFEHLAGNEVQGGAGGKIDILKSASQPVLPPIAVRESKSGQVSKLDGSKLHEARSPHVPRGRREFIRWKRSPSPVLRCVPPAPPPPPPSPVAGVRKRRGFPTVRSGSSSPRHWGVFNWPDNQLKTLGPEGIVPTAWRTRCIPNTPVHPLTGTLLRERLVAIPPSALEQEHPDVAFPMKTSTLHQSYPTMATIMSKLHKEIEAFCLQVAAENAARKPYVNIAVKKVTHALQVLWPRSRTKIFGSNATGLALPNSDVDLVVCLPPVRNLEPIKEAGILEGRNGIKETCLQHAARYLADQDWVKSDSLKTIENTTIPVIMLVAKCFPDNSLDNQPKLETAEDIAGSVPGTVGDEATSRNCPPWGAEKDRHCIRVDISFESASHTGLLTAELVKELVNQFPAITPLALVLKQFLTDRGLDQPYTGGLSSYCLVLLITRFLQHQCHLGWPLQVQSLGSLLMDFLNFFGCVFDPRRMCISIRGGGMYVSRDRLHGIDPLHIEDPLHSMNNVGRNCFRILQCTKAFADAYVTLEKELIAESSVPSQPSLLSKILPSLSAEH